MSIVHRFSVLCSVYRGLLRPFPRALMRTDILCIMVLIHAPQAFTAQSQSTDFSLKCPDEWIDEQTAGVTCVVRRAYLNERCHEVSLHNYKAGQGSIKYCGAMQLTARSGCSAHTQCVGPCTCSCREDAAHYTLTFYLQVDKKKHSGDWHCYWTHSDNPACKKGFRREAASCKGVWITPMIYGMKMVYFCLVLFGAGSALFALMVWIVWLILRKYGPPVQYHRPARLPSR